MSSDTDRLTRKLRRAMNQQARLEIINQALRRRVKLLRKALADPETSLLLATGVLRRG